MFFFGLITMLQGFTHNLSGLIATRFFLGVVESGVFPACFYHIAMWYKRAEAQKRYSFFFSSTTLAGGFGGLLASAIGKMDGMRGYRGWRWVFILGRDSPAVEAARTLINSPHYKRASSPALSHYCWSFSSQTSRRKPLGFPPRNAPS